MQRARWGTSCDRLPTYHWDTADVVEGVAALPAHLATDPEIAGKPRSIALFK